MATIVQNYGPIYGEVVNGTVQGRPNGSVYVPISNTISLSIPDSAKYVVEGDNHYINVCSSTGVVSTRYNVVAQAQDLQSYIQMQISESADFSDYASINLGAGRFNNNERLIGYDPDGLVTIVQDNDYYVRAQLMSSTGVPVATSEVITVKGVVI